MNVKGMNVSGVWEIFYIVYFVITTLLTIGSLILIKRFVKNDKTKTLLVKIFAAILLALIITNRIAYTVQYVVIEPLEGITWLYIFPETLCATYAFILSISLLFFKKDNCATHAVIYMAVAGALLTIFYPSFLDTQGLWEVGTITSLLYHNFMLFLALLVIVFCYVNPSTKKWYLQSVTYMLIICYGLFYLNVLMPSIKDVFPVMNINLPLLASQPILTSWWMLGIIYFLFQIICLLIYDYFVNKKSFKKIGDELIHFYRYINK